MTHHRDTPRPTGRPSGLRRTARLAAVLAVALVAPLAAATPAGAVGAPSTPALVALVAGDQSVTARFNAPSFNGGATITSYTVSCLPRNAATAVTTTVTMPAGLQGTVSGLTNGTPHTCRVKASNGIDSPWSTTMVATPRTVPDAPTIASAAPGNNQLSVAVTPGAAGGSPITGYTVVCTGPATVTVRAATSPVVVRPLVNNASYSCTATAQNVAGSSAASTAVSATPYNFVPVPTGLTATPLASQLRLSFSPGPANGSAATTSYRAVCSAGAASRTSMGTSSPLTVTGLTNGTEYSCAVRAVAGTALSELTTAVTATPRTTPATPLSPSATPAASSLVVSWSAVPDSANGGSPLTDYQVVCTARTGGSRTVTAAASATSATVTGLANGTAYACTVAARNAAGSSPASVTASATPRTVPGAPVSLVAAPRHQSVQLVWAAPPQDGGAPITDYTVEIQSSTDAGDTWSAWSTLTDPVTPATGWLVPSLTNGTWYRLRVSALNVAGAGATTTTSAPVVPRTMPDAPTSLAATPADARAQLSFGAPAQNGGSAVTGYSASCSGAGVTRTALGLPTPVSGTYTLDVTGLTNGTAYSCVVRAINAAGTSVATSAVSVTPRTTAGAPALVGVAFGDETLTATFSAPSTTGGAAITSYQLTCTPPTGAAATATLTLPSATLVATVSGLTNGTAYSCVVSAVNAAGASRASNAVSATPRRVPDAPEAGAASIDDGRTSVAFTPVPRSGNGGATMTSYTASCAAEGRDTQATTGVTSPLVVRGLTNGVEYACTVVASNSVGASGPSQTMDVTPRTVPGVPTGLSGQVGDAQVALTWTAPAQNGGAAISEYRLQVSTDGGTTWTTVERDEPTATSHTATGLTNGTAYRFRVAAVNDRGASSWTRAVGPLVPRTVPDAPTDLAATEGSRQLALTWTAPAHDGGAAVTDYRVEVSADGGDTWTTFADGTSVATSATVTGLTNGRTYSCTVVATNAAGDSAPSAALVGTPATVPGDPTDVGVSFDTTTATVTFTAPDSDGGSPLLGYRAYCLPLAGGDEVDPVDLDSPVAAPIELGGLTAGSPYSCWVVARNAVGESAP